MLKKIWRENKGFIVFLFGMLFFRSAFANWYHVPTGSMKPNILIGDRVFVNKLAYDVKVPFTDFNLASLQDPTKGEVVVFYSKASEERLIKRVIGLPGDRVSMTNNKLSINGEPLEMLRLDESQVMALRSEDQFAEFYWEIDSNNRRYTVRLEEGISTPLANFSEVVVPDDSLLVLGDNRNNSADSRVIGFVPRGELIGRAERVMFSLDKDNYYLPRDRTWIKL